MDSQTDPIPISPPGEEAHAPPLATSAKGRARAMIATGALVIALLIGGVTSVLAASPPPSPSGSGSSGASGASPAPAHACDRAPGSSGSSSSGTSSS